jgi:CxxC motif-containing protein
MSEEICNVTCIVCPTGCKIRVLKEDDRVLEVSGNSCKRGEAYASQEAIAPKRTLTTSVRVLQGDFHLVSVKSAVPVPKSCLLDVMRSARLIVATAPIRVGDVVATNVLGLGIDLVATRAVDRVS